MEDILPFVKHLPACLYGMRVVLMCVCMSSQPVRPKWHFFWLSIGQNVVAFPSEVSGECRKDCERIVERMV